MLELAQMAGSYDASISERAPHVLLVLDQFPKALGGGERIVLRLAALLPQYGFRVSILTFAIHPESTAPTLAICPLYLLPLTRTYDGNAFRAAFLLRQFLHLQNVKIVQTFFESSDLWAGAVVKLFSDAKLIWSRRDMGILRGRKHWMAYRILSGMPDLVFAVSEKVRRVCIDDDGIDPSRVLVTYNGLDLESWADRPEQRGKPVITTVGNIRYVKGHDVLAHAAALVLKRFPQCTFRIAGDVLEPDYWKDLQRLLNDLSITRSFQFSGSIRDLRPYLAQATMFVLPSRSEGFSNAIIEAMAAALPIVATDVGGNAEAILHEQCGLIVPHDNAEALAAAICRFLDDPAAATAMGVAARVRVEKNFTTEAMMATVTTAYRRLLATSS